jgi:quercetin dioxygenase-like cupin family protein
MSAAKKKSAARRPAKRKASNGKLNSLKNTVRTNRAATGSLKYLAWNDVEVEAMNPLLGRQLIVGHQVMLARVLLKKGCIVPLHSHVNEQLSYILEGALKFYIDGKEIVVRAGEVLTIPPNMPHKAEAMEDTVDLDIFNPPRADWINKTDSYLRK